MYIFSDRLYKKDEIVLDDNKKQIIFTTLGNEEILEWLGKHGFPESFIEDITNEDQSVTYEENDRFKLAILKYFQQDEEDDLLFHANNVVIIMTEKKFIFLAKEKKLIKTITNKLYRRYKTTDSLEYIMYSVIDIMVDHTMGIVDMIDDRLEEIEDRIFDESLDEQEVQKLDAWADDLKVGLEQEIKEIDRQIKEVRRTAATGSSAPPRPPYGSPCGCDGGLGGSGGGISRAQSGFPLAKSAKLWTLRAA